MDDLLLMGTKKKENTMKRKRVNEMGGGTRREGGSFRKRFV